MSDPHTQEPFQPSYADLKPKPKPPKRVVNTDEETRRAARYDIRQMIVEGNDDPTIIKIIRERYDVAYTTAKRYLNLVYEDINRLKASDTTSDRELQTWLAVQRYEMAFKIAAEKKDVRNMLDAIKRLTELQGLVPENRNGVTINNVMAGNIPHVSAEVQRLSNKELESIIDVPHRRIAQQSVENIPEVLTAEEAENLLKECDE